MLLTMAASSRAQTLRIAAASDLQFAMSDLVARYEKASGMKLVVTYGSSGNFRTQALNDAIGEIGADRVMYSVDYPFEDMVEAKEWFDQVAIGETDRAKIARGNAQKLFRLQDS